MKTLAITAIALACSSCIHADESTELQEPKKPHRIYFGPDFFFGQASKYEGEFNASKTSQHYTFRLGYDYLQADALYAGVNALYGPGRTAVKVKIPSEDDVFLYRRARVDGSAANVEGRLGYTAQASQAFRLTPFLGLGFYYFDVTESSVKESAQWLYGALGLRSDYAVNSLLDIGLNLKGMRNFSVRHQVRIKESGQSASFRIKGVNSWGYEIGLPLTFHCNSHWDIQAEPYFMNLNTKNSEKFFGGRLSLGYSF